MRVRGVDLAIRESGTGVPLLWGHGLLGSMAQEDLADLLDWDAIATRSQLLRYDARGHGLSEATLASEDYRWPELGRDLLALADAAGAERAVFGGLSMGCATTLHAAAAAPDRVRALLLVAPPTAWRTRPRQARIYRAVASAVEHFGLRPFQWFISLGMLAPAPAHRAKLQRSMAESLRRADPRAVIAALRGAADSDLPDPDVLRGVGAPALVLAWRGDPTHPLSTAEQLAELLPRADLRVADSLDAVRAWSPAICGLLESVSSPPPVAAPAPHA